MRTPRARGFTLVELLVVMAVVVILVVTATPSVSDWLQNAKTRSVAESVQNGLRFAQTEAARLSRLTTFTATSTGWTVDYIAVVNAADAFPHPLQTSPAGSLQGATIAAGSGTPAVIQFNSFGRVFGAATTAGPFTPLAADATVDVTNPNGGSRKLRIVLSQGGKTRMCDPDKTFSSTTPDGC
jgi:type IV fimbrial biogenesis protein FimT